ncbi:MAG: TetR family transcriptional regulator C-terminal domain-containing protein [Candidatus Microbacterium phytovorans]|uniref:TetR family transcriptional regulator C-terminal domain-containing protein n=1 Tax=Candidatus Microbacterium phytovorans TaxID=3121374 RepID=A0AAJ5W1J5_9MICO|nr:TetR family transcriptional regulator C-terminal domain-containing protein [Microbacterium sp.]WEK12720.1 MAG: TetR family transcriptional regulator C-terminal domain-containing protein [Microbacterium sp.]
MTGPSTTRPRAARTSPDERRTQVAEAARAIAIEAGLDAVTLRAVAARMAVAPALVAHYTPRMDDLVADTFGALVAAERHDVAALLDTADEPARRLGILLETLLDGTRDDITLVWVQAWAMGARSEALASRVRDEMDAWQTAIAREVRQGMDAGVFDPGDEAAIAWHLLAMIDGLNAHSLVRWNAHPDRRALTARAVAGLLGVSPDDLAPRR